MNLTFKAALRELSYFWKFSFLFVFILSLGITSLLVFDSVHLSFLQHFESQSKNILRADIKITSFERMSETVKKMILKDLHVEYQFSNKSSFLSNLVVEQENKLSQINMIDSSFPLYGDLKLSTLNGEVFYKKDRFILKKNEIILDQKLAHYLNLKLDNKVKLGRSTLLVKAIILKDSGRAFEFTSFLPKAFIDFETGQNTGLLSFGSRIQYDFMLKLPNSFEVDSFCKKLETDFQKNLKADHSYTITNYNQASRRINRNLKLFKTYLSFVSLIALVLCLSGITYLYRSYLYEKVHQIAVRMSLGASQNSILLLGLVHLFILTILSMILASLTSILTLNLLPLLIPNLVPVGLEITISLELIFFSFCLIFSLCVASCYPLLYRLSLIEPALLFQGRDFSFFKENESFFSKYGSYLPLFCGLVAVCVYRSHTLSIAFGFLLGFSIVFLIISFCAFVFLALISRMKLDSVIFRLSILNLTRNKQAFLLSSVTFGIACLLIGILPQLQVNLEKEMLRSDSYVTPDYFLFDVQDEQIDGLKEFVKNKNTKLSHLTPMIRGRIQSVKGISFVDWVKEHQDLSGGRRYGSLLLRRGVNISYRDDLSDSETLILGEKLPQNYEDGSDALISVEEGFAKNLNLQIGDSMMFNIQGMEILGKVHNFRKVDWNSFQPNFFILFQDGVLNDAPKTWLSNLHLKGQNDADFQREFYKHFENVSMVDLKEVVEKILKMVDQIILCVQFLAWLCILVGLSVLYSIIRFDLEKQKSEIHLFSILGSSNDQITSLYGFQQALISVFSIFGGIGLSYVTAYVIWSIWFSSNFVFNYQPLLLIPILFVLTLSINHLALTRILAKPFTLFEE
ncbi:hypothetical protein MJH12_19750 [bacterium]|nr:hypothetical protein [bacterium]